MMQKKYDNSFQKSLKNESTPEYLIDFRSDTVTKPPPKMWEKLGALVGDNSQIGDDGFGEDPTVIALQERAAKLLGKEDALLITSGIQGNLISILSQTNPGEEILLEEQSHTYDWEVGGISRIGGLLPRLYRSDGGIPSLLDIDAKLSGKHTIHKSMQTLLSVENTHNMHGGVVIPEDHMRKVRNIAEEYHLKIHLDGARLFNALVALDIPVIETHRLTRYVDSVQICLTKGLACPVGSIIAGSTEFINRARIIRKMLGGEWRQAGVFAIMGLFALEPEWINRLKEDHQNAVMLAKGIEENFPFISMQKPQTNILFIEAPPKIPLGLYNAKLRKHGIQAFCVGQKMRFVTHYGISKMDIQYTLDTMREVFPKNFH